MIKIFLKMKKEKFQDFNIKLESIFLKEERVKKIKGKIETNI